MTVVHTSVCVSVLCVLVLFSLFSQNCVRTLLDCYVQRHAPQGSLVELGKAAFSLLGRLPSLQVG